MSLTARRRMGQVDLVAWSGNHQRLLLAIRLLGQDPDRFLETFRATCPVTPAEAEHYLTGARLVAANRIDLSKAA